MVNLGYLRRILTRHRHITGLMQLSVGELVQNVIDVLVVSDTAAFGVRGNGAPLRPHQLTHAIRTHAESADVLRHGRLRRIHRLHGAHGGATDEVRHELQLLIGMTLLVEEVLILLGHALLFEGLLLPAKLTLQADSFLLLAKLLLTQSTQLPRTLQCGLKPL